MPLFGKIVIIKRNGIDGIHFPLTASSCLFGRKTECDIRIQLPQVSKEHCKIEVNENKEAMLINLSTVNPTQLNGNSFQQPAHLKHGDVFTIVDRSFRFEYPPQVTPRKRLSRTPKNETLQVLHVQQVPEVEVQRPRSKSPYASVDTNVDFEGQNFDENDKQNTEEDISRTVPAKHATPKSAYRTAKANRRENEMSPFSKLYDLLKHEIDVKTQQDGNKEIPMPRQTEINAQQISLLVCPSGQEGQTKEKEKIIGENIEHSTAEEQEINIVEINQSSSEKNSSASFSGSHRTSVSKVKPRDIQERSHLHFQDSVSVQGENVPGNSEDIKMTKYVTTKSKRERDQNETCSPKACCAESFECIDTICHTEKSIEQPMQIANGTNRSLLTDISEADKYAVSMPKYKRKSLQAHFSPSAKTNEISFSNLGTPLIEQVPSLGLKATETSTEIQKKDVFCSSVGGSEPCIFRESNNYSKQKRNSKQFTPRKSLNAEEVLKEIHDETFSISITKERDSETVAFSLGYSNSKSPKGSIRQSKTVANKSPFSELLIPESLTQKDASSASHKYHSGVQRGRQRSSGKMAEETLEREPSQESDQNYDSQDSNAKEKLTSENYQQKLDMEDANIVVRPHKLTSKRRCSESAALLKDDVASEISTSSLPTEDKSGETKRSPQKRKSGELDLPLQPLGKRKRVSFGGHLSPELFDKSLPPNSPLKRGAIPARLSLPFGNSPRAVLKKGHGFKRLIIKDLSEPLQGEKLSQKTAARRSPAASPSTKRSPAALPSTRRSPAASLAPLEKMSPKVTADSPSNTPSARRSPAASPSARRSPAASLSTRRSPAASMAPLGKMSPKFTANSPPNTPFAKGRFSVSHISTPSPTSKEQGAAATEVDANERDFTEVRTPRSFDINQNHQVSVPTTPKQLVRRSMRFTAKRTPTKRRSGAVETIRSKRRSGASKANLLVAKTWAEVVKLGAPRPQVKAVKKCVPKGRSAKKLTKSPKTPARKVKGHFSTGHADSPATIVIGRAHTTTVKLVGQAPRVVKNYALKQDMDINESFTGIIEMFRTPVNENQKSPSLSAAQKTDLTPSCTDTEISEIYTPEESGEMAISPLNTSGMSQQRKDSQDVVSRFLKVEKTPKSVDVKLKQTSEEEKALLGEEVEMGNSQNTSEKHVTEVTVGPKRLMKTPEQKMEPIEALSGVKRLLRTPKQKMEPVEALSGVKRLLRTPKQKTEPVDALSGIKRLLRTPKQKTEPVDALSGVKRLMRTPKQKVEPVDTLSGVKRLMRTPKQKMEPVDALSGVKRLMRTPEQKTDPIEVLSAVKRLLRTPKQKTELVDALSGVKRLLRTPKQKTEPVDALSGVKRLLRTPKQKTEPVDALSGVKRLLRTPKQKTEPVDALSGVKRLLRTPEQKTEPVDALSGVKRLLRTPEQKTEPVDALSGIKRLLRTPEQKTEPVEVLSGIKRLLRTPEQKTEPVEVLSGIKRLLKTPEQKTEPLTDEIALKRLKTPTQEKQEVNDLVGVSVMKTTQKQKCQPVEDTLGISHVMKTSKQRIQSEDMEGIKSLLKISKERVEPIEDMFGISRLLRTPREKYLPVDDFVGLQNLMAEPKQKYPNTELDYFGVKEMFDTPKEIKVKSPEVVDLMQKNKSRTDPKREHKSRGSCEREELKQEKRLEIYLEKTFLPSVKSRNRNIKNEQELQENFEHACISPKGSEIVKNTESHDKALLFENLMAPQLNLVQESIALSSKDQSTFIEKSTRVKQQEVEKKEEAVDFTSVVKSLGNTERTSRHMQDEIVSKTDVQDKLEKNKEAVSSVEINGSYHRPRRGKRNLESHQKDSIMPQRENTNMKQNLQTMHESGTNHILMNENDGSIKTAIVSSCSKNVRGHSLQTGLMTPKDKSDQDSVENNEKVVLSLRKSSRREKKSEMLESLVPAKRTRSGKIEDSQQGSTDQDNAKEKPQRQTTRSTRRAETAMCTQTGKQNFTKSITEAPALEECEYNNATLEIMIKEKKGRNRKQLEDSKEESIEIEPGNVRNVHKPKRISKEIVVKTHTSIKNETKVSQGPKEAETNKRHGTKRGKRCILDVKEDDFAENEEMIPQNMPETEPETVSTKDSLRSLQTGKRSKTKEAQNNSTAAMTYDPKERTVFTFGKRVRKGDGKQEAPETKQIEMLENNPTETKENTLRRDRGKKVHFEFEDASYLRGKHIFPEGDNKDQNETSGNIPSETNGNLLRRGRRKEVDIRSQATNSIFLREECRLPDSKEETPKKDRDAILKSIAFPTKENPFRRGTRKQVDHKVQTASSTYFGGNCSLPEDSGKYEMPKDQNVSLEAIASPAKEKLSGRGKQNEVLSTRTASCTSVRGKRSLSENDKEEIAKEDQNFSSGNTISRAKANPSRKSRRKQVDLTTQAPSSTALGGKSSLTENDGKEEIPKEDQNVHVENTISQAKANPSRKGRRKQVDLTTQAGSSTALKRKSSLTENDDKEEIPKEDENIPSENSTSRAKVNPPRKGRRKQADLTTQADSSTSLGGKSSLPENDGKEEIPKESQTMPLENTTSQAKVNPPRKGRRKQADLTTQAASSTALRRKSSLTENDDKEEIPKEDENIPSENSTSRAKVNPPRKGRRKQADLTTQADSSTSLGGKSSLPENDGKEEIPKEDQTMPLENTTSQAKVNPPRKGRRKQADLTTQADSSTSLGGKSSLPENDGKEEIPKEDQTMPLENTTSQAKVNPPRKGRRKQADLTTQADSSTSLGGKSSLPENDGKEEIPKEDQTMPLENTTSQAKVNPPRKGRRKQADLTTQAASSTALRRKSSLTENDGKEEIPKEDENIPSENSTSRAKVNPPRKGRRKQADLTTQADSSTSLGGKSSLPENDGEEEIPKESQTMPLENTTSQAKVNPPRKGRRKQADLATQADSSMSLGGKSSLTENDGKEKVTKEDQNVPSENINSHVSGRGRRKQGDLTTQAASSNSLRGKSSLPENGGKEKIPKESQNVPLENTTSLAKASLLRKGRGTQVDTTSQAASSSSVRGKRHVKDDEKASKKIRTECGESITLQKETRSKTKGELDKGGISIIKSVGGTERKRRTSARAKK